MDFLSQFRHIHLIGIGGISVSALARIARARNITVTGSDVIATEITNEISLLGVVVTIPHAASSITHTVDMVVYSEAVPKNNPERLYAELRGIKTMTVFEFWGAYIKGKKVIAISGTNGKSTTTAMIGHLLADAGFDPTVIVGTRITEWKSNVRVGASDWVVIEADEYHDHMLQIQPHIAVITNIAPDHLDYYKNIETIIAHFEQWVSKLGASDTLVLNADDEHSMQLRRPRANCITVGLEKKADVRSKAITMRASTGAQLDRTDFNIVDNELDWGGASLAIPGLHNVANAIAAAVAARAAGVGTRVICKSFERFKGTWRRFEKVGKYKGATLYSDYAHHPDAIRATIQAARSWYPFERLVILFQPHQHNRTKTLFTDFVQAFGNCDELIISEIYDVAGREAFEDQSVSSKDLVGAIKKLHLDLSARYTPNLARAETALKSSIKKGDVVIVMGAGDVDEVARRLAT